MRCFFLWTWITLLACLTPGLPAMAADVVLTDQTVVMDQGQFALLEDTSGRLALSEVRRLYAEGAFRPITGGIAEGYSASSFWAVARLQRSDASISRWAISIAPAYLDQVDIYFIHRGQVVDHIAMGDQAVDQVHDLHSRLHLTGIDLPAGETEMFIRLQTTSTSLMLMKLMPASSVGKHIDNAIYLEGILIGILLAILAINTLNGIWLHNMLFLHFVTYEISLIITLLLATGIFGQLFPAFYADDLNQLMQYAVIFSGFLAFVFFYGLLSFKSRQRWLVDLMFITGIGHCLWGLYMITLGQFTSAMAYINWFLIVYVFLMVPVLLMQWRDLSGEQKIRVGGFLLFGFFVVANALFVSGVLGVTRYTVFIAPVMILSFQLCLHFVLVASMRRSERILNEAEQKARLAHQEAEWERQQRQSNEMFMAMFSHEVRTPLTVIDAAAQAMQRLERKAGASEGKQLSTRYQRIRQSVKRIAELLQLSDVFAQSSATDDPALVWKYDLIQLIDEVIQDFGGRHSNRIHFFHAMESLNQTRHVPQQAMRVIIRNLVDNALKYSPSDRPVDIYIDQGQYVISLTVRDHGKGLTEHVRKHMFERYFRGGEESNTPGLGLGLYIVKELADRFGIQLLFTTGHHGTSFTCSLPSDNSEVQA